MAVKSLWSTAMIFYHCIFSKEEVLVPVSECQAACSVVTITIRPGAAAVHNQPVPSVADITNYYCSL